MSTLEQPQTQAMSPHLHRFLSRLQGVRLNGPEKWLALCPGHNDQHASLNVTLGKKGQVIFHCHVCNPDKAARAAMLTKLGLTWADLEPRGGDGRVTLYKKSPADLAVVTPLADGAVATEEEQEDNARQMLYGVGQKDIDLRNQVYSLLNLAGLTKGHRRQLESRGLSAEAIKANGYFSVERTAGAIFTVIHTDSLKPPSRKPRREPTDPLQFLHMVPGYTKDGLEPRRGLFIPIRNAEGHILTAQVRAGQPSKYLWLKRSKPIPHVPLGVKPGEEVWVTEGPLKADVATFYGYPCVAVPGVANWRTIMPYLRRWGTKRVVIAFDADRQSNASVTKSFNGFAKELTARGFDVQVATWTEEDGNGLDDLLHNGSRPCVVSLHEADPLFQVTVSGLIHWQEAKTAAADAKTAADLWLLLDAFASNMPADELLSSAARVWLAIFRHAAGGEATMSQETLAKKTGIGVRSVTRAVADLKRLGLLVVKKQGNNLKEKPSVYRLPRTPPVEAGQLADTPNLASYT